MTGSIARIAAPSALGVGLVVGGVAAAMSLQPTISKRSTMQQGIVTGVSAAGGIAVGAGLAKLANTFGTRVPGGPVALMGAMALGGAALGMWSNRGDGIHTKFEGALGSAGTVVGAVGAAGLAVVGARYLGPAAGKAVLAAGIGGLAWKMHSQSTETADAPTRVVADAKVAGERIANRRIDARRPPIYDTVSGGRRSTFSMAEIGKEGRHFVQGVVPAYKIREVMGSGVQPVRVYAPLHSADTPQARVELAMREAEQLGAFDGTRKQLVIATTTGSGFVDPPSIQAAEFMSRGHVATIALQYAEKPSVLSTDKVPLGGETTKLMLEAVKERIAQMPPSKRPEVVLFGESLGAWAQQDPLAGTGTKLLDELGVSRSLWVGSPYSSTYAREQEAGKIPGGAVARFDRIEDVEALTPAERAKVKHVMLTHEQDPVSVLDATTLAYQRPEWLPAHGDKARGVPQSMHFVPGVSLAQGIVDLLNGTHPEPGKFEAHSHDYRADLPAFVRMAYGHDNPRSRAYVSDHQVSRITSELMHMEKNRAALMARDPEW